MTPQQNERRLNQRTRLTPPSRLGLDALHPACSPKSIHRKSFRNASSCKLERHQCISAFGKGSVRRGFHNSSPMSLPPPTRMAVFNTASDHDICAPRIYATAARAANHCGRRHVSTSPAKGSDGSERWATSLPSSTDGQRTPKTHNKLYLKRLHNGALDQKETRQYVTNKPKPECAGKPTNTRFRSRNY